MMTYKVTCPSCKYEYSTSHGYHADMTERDHECPSCGHAFSVEVTIPEVDADPSEVDADPYAED